MMRHKVAIMIAVDCISVGNAFVCSVAWFGEMQQLISMVLKYSKDFYFRLTDTQSNNLFLFVWALFL